MQCWFRPGWCSGERGNWEICFPTEGFDNYNNDEFTYIKAHIIQNYIKFKNCFDQVYNGCEPEVEYLSDQGKGETENKIKGVCMECKEFYPIMSSSLSSSEEQNEEDILIEYIDRFMCQLKDLRTHFIRCELCVIYQYRLAFFLNSTGHSRVQ